MVTVTIAILPLFRRTKTAAVQIIPSMTRRVSPHVRNRLPLASARRDQAPLIANSYTHFYPVECPSLFFILTKKV